MTRYLPIVLLLCACSPKPDPVPLPPSYCATVECACVRLCQLGCPECQPECEETLLHVMAARLTHVDPGCMASAGTKAEMRQCPAVTCE